MDGMEKKKFPPILKDLIRKKVLGENMGFFPFDYKISWILGECEKTSPGDTRETKRGEPLFSFPKSR